MMVKSAGTDYVEVLTGLSPKNINEKIRSLSSRNLDRKWAVNNIAEMTLTRQGDYYSFMGASIGVGRRQYK